MSSRVILTRAQYNALKADAELGTTFREWRRRLLASESAGAIAAAERWADIARAPSFAELERRRAVPGPDARKIDPVAAARWAATGYSHHQETAA